MVDKKKCPKCGKKISANWIFHKKCGWKSNQEVSDDVPPVRGGGISISPKALKGSLKTIPASFVSTFMKHKVWILLLIPILLAFYIRILPWGTPITETWARDTVNEMVRNQISAQVLAQYPNLGTAEINRIVDSEISKIPKAELDKMVSDVRNHFNNQLRDDNGVVYLHGIDSYQHLRRARNVVSHGNMGDLYEGNGAVNGLMTLDDGSVVAWDGLRNAPFGKPATGNDVHVVGGAYAYKFLSFFTDLSIMQVFYFIPAIIAALSVILMFLLGKRLGGSHLGFFAATALGAHNAYVIRSYGGFSDTDAYQILFGLLAAWLFLEAIESKNLKSRTIWSCLLGSAIGFFTFAWAGWWYVMLFCIGTLGIYGGVMLVLHQFKKRNFWVELPKLLTILGLLLLTSFLVSTLLVGSPVRWVQFVSGPFMFITLKDIATGTLFPNINVTIAELGHLSFEQIVGRFGFLLWVGMGGIILSAFYKTKKGNFDYKYSIFFSLWAIATFYATLNGNRFLMLFVPAWAFGLAVVIDFVIKGLSSLSSKVYLKKSIATFILFSLGLLLLVPMVTDSIRMTSSIVPIMNDAWYSSLDKINREAHPDAIINSWWDFGHWFTAIGQRRTTFDGAHQVPYGAFWVGHTLLTDNEDLAVGILRMLDCGADMGEDRLRIHLGYNINGHPEVIELMKKLVLQPTYDDAHSFLLRIGLTESEVSDVLQYTHCVPPDNYFITSGDMIAKASVWGHFGLWDFNRALMYNNISGRSRDEKIRLLINEFGLSSSVAMSYADEIIRLERDPSVRYPGDRWIAIYPGFVSSSSCNLVELDNLEVYSCGNGPVIDPATWEVWLHDGRNRVVPQVFTYVDNGNYQVQRYDEGVDIEVIFYERDGRMRSYLSVGGLATSLFSRLHFYNGVGLEHFELFSSKRAIDNSDILVWYVHWDGMEVIADDGLEG